MGDLKGIVVLAIFAGICWYCAFIGFRKKRYMTKSCQEVHGRVRSFRARSTGDQWHPVIYEIEVIGDNGQSYQVSSERRAAKKYKNKEDIVLLVFKGIDFGAAEEYQEQLQQAEDYGTPDDERREMLQKIKEMNEEVESINEKLKDEAPIFIKEEVKSSIAEAVVGTFFGTILTILIAAMIFIK